MTLILTLACREHTILLADRRLTAAGKIVSEEEGKAGAVVFHEGRMLYGFTGLARSGTFETRRWLIESLRDCASGDQALYQTLYCLKEKATVDFKTIPTLRRLAPGNRRLAIIFTGYLYTRDPPLIGSAIISNYFNPTEDRLHHEAQDEFWLSYTNEKEPRSEDATFVVPIGVYRAVRPDDVEVLRAMMTERKPAKAVIGKAIKMMLDFADHPASSGTIGKQISWLKMLPDPSAGIQSGYYSNVPTTVAYTPNLVVLKDGGTTLFDMGQIEAMGPNGPLIVAVPKVGRNAPCPCNSGKKYKHCHGSS